MKFNLGFIILISISNLTFGQTNKSELDAFAGFYFSSSGQNPFWLRSNTWGEVPLKSNYGLIGINYQGKSVFSKRSSLEYGGNARLNVGDTISFIIPEAYVAYKTGVFRFQAGRRKEIQGLVDTTLSSGSYAVSQNAIPTPKIEISIPEYTPILFKKLISIKGNFAHGWFGSTDSVKNYLQHQLSFYTRIGKPNWNTKFYLGFNHQAQWGGRPAVPFTDNGNLISSYGNDFSTFIKVVTGASLNKNGSGANGNGASNEDLNRAGNHLGTIDVGFDIIGDNFKTFVYRQSYYEDGSLYYLNNISDGLLGIAFSSVRENTIFDKLVIEFFSSKSQGGPIYKDNPPELRGSDNYYNNSIYKDGWEYKKKIIGTPFINRYGSLLENATFSDFSNSKYGSVNADYYKVNNRVSSIYFGLSLIFGDLKNITRFSFSNSLGNYIYTTPVNLNQFSIGETLIYTKPSFSLELNIGIDSGQLWENSVGLGFLFRKYF